MAHNPLAPDNDLLRTFFLEDVDPVTFAKTPVTTGSVTAFLSTTKEGSAADPTLSVSAVHVGVASPTADEYPEGTWGIEIDATALTSTLLNTHFSSSGTAFLIVERAGAVRRYEQLSYKTALAATLV